MKVVKSLPHCVKEILLNHRLSAFTRLKLRKNGVYGKEKKNLLHLACKYSSIKIIKYCVQRFSLKINQKTKKGNNSLHSICKTPNLIGVKYLCSIGSQTIINSQNKKGQTPLNIAAKYNNEDICIYLINQHVNIHIQDRKGYAVGHWAAANAMMRLLHLLKEKSYNFLLNNVKNENILHCAAWSGSIECFEYAIQFISVNSESLKGNFGYYCKGNWKLLSWIIRNNHIKQNKSKSILLTIEAPLELFKEGGIEPKITDILRFDRHDILSWSYYQHKISDYTLVALSSLNIFRPKCRNWLRAITNWNAAKGILFLHSTSKSNFNFLPIVLIREIISYIR